MILAVGAAATKLFLRGACGGPCMKILGPDVAEVFLLSPTANRCCRRLVLHAVVVAVAVFGGWGFLRSCRMVVIVFVALVLFADDYY